MQHEGMSDYLAFVCLAQLLSWNDSHQVVRNAIHKVDVLMPIRRAEDRVALRIRHSHCSPHGRRWRRTAWS